MTLIDPNVYPLISVRDASKGPLVRIKVLSVRVKVRNEGSNFGSLALNLDYVSQVTRLLGQCKGASRGACVRKKVRSV